MPRKKSTKKRSTVRLYYEKNKYPILLYTPFRGARQERIRLSHLALTGDEQRDEQLRLDAEEARLRLIREIRDGRGPKQSGNGRDISLLEFYEQVRQQKYSKLRSHRNTLRHVEIYFGAENPLIREVTSTMVEGFKDYLLQTATSPQGKRLQPSTVGTYLDCLKVVFRHAEARGYLTTNPARLVQRPKSRNADTNPLSVEDVWQLEKTKCKNEEVSRAFLFSVRTGLRKVDLRSLRWRDLEGGKVLVRQQKTDAVVVVPIGPQASKVLGKRGLDDAYVFNLPSDQTIANHLEQWCKDAGLKRRHTFHDARHTYGYLLVNEGIDLYPISKLMGHSSTRHTERYAKISSTTLKDVAKKNPLF